MAREYGEPLASADGAGFPVPLMLAYAREDPTVPPEVGEKLGPLVPDAEFDWIERRSHFAQVDIAGRPRGSADGLFDPHSGLQAEGGGAAVTGPT